jgi:hypothetical protein
MRHEWSSLTFLHWPVDPQALRRRLPAGLEIDTVDGAGFVGVVLFHLTVRPPRGPALPWACSFPEANVRTYVLGPDGRPGIIFLSLDAPRLGAVAAARASTWRLDYHWARMRLERHGDLVRYTSRRRWPGRAGASSRAVVRVGRPYQLDELTALDHFLTARWSFFSRARRGLARTDVWHPAWALRRASALEVDGDPGAAAGLPSPDGGPLVHFSDGTQALVGPPHVL